MSLENVVFSGIKDKSKYVKNKYNISDIIDKNTKYVIIKNIDSIDSYSRSSPKIKLAIKYRIPIISENKFDEIIKNY
tara:strand:- start:321 stop:551 length:231 start_codon:yes stop_codon:yes gene_type:complete